MDETTTQLTETQWERVAYGSVLAIVNQVLDNGELDTVDIVEYLPHAFDTELYGGTAEKFYTELKARVEKVLSDIEEEAAKRDG
jgi:hypothetical protein